MEPIAASPLLNESPVRDGIVALFLLTFFFIYGGFHFYFFLRVRAAFAPGAAAQALIAVLLILGLMAPVIIRTSERYGFETLAHFMSWAGYIWMAVLLLFFSASILFELYRFLAYLTGLALRTDAAAFLPSSRTFFIIPAVVALGAVLYGVFDARSIRSESLLIHSAKIPQETGRIRIVQISDVHVGVLIRGGYLAAILRKVQEAAPDLLVSTGDLVDGQGNDLSEASAQLREIRPRYGKFAVTGNHEFYAGLDEAMEFTRNAGFTVLRGRTATVAGAIDLAGVDDPGFQRLGAPGAPSDREILSRAGVGRFTVLLKHQPLVERDALGLFDLQLSGHTHGGQIFPFSLVTRMVFPFHRGNYRLTGDSLLHVSRGTGTWGPPVRFLAPPEITVIDLLPG
jgi:predicted MPP superfamily phosphohydrolase